MWPVHLKYEGTDGRPCIIDLIMIPMDTLRRRIQFPHNDSDTAYNNLLTWIKHLGPALFNPITVFDTTFHLQGMKYRGSHRLRTLERLDFNFVYAYYQQGIKRHTKVIHDKEMEWHLKWNVKPPIKTSKEHCPACGIAVTCRVRGGWRTNPEFMKKFYKCRCGQEGSFPFHYPEPI
jgi:DNA-directed RNA polymerase subunit M/transcription elongation factor TFIIS